MFSRRHLRTFLVGLLIIATSHVADAGTFSASSRSEAKLIKCRIRAVQFLSHAAFGGTPGEVETLAQRMRQIGIQAAKREWIKEQLSKPATSHHAKVISMIKGDGFDPYYLAPDYPRIGQNRYKYHAWWDTAIAGEDQLRQRMAWALAQIFAVDQGGAGFRTVRADASGEPQYLGIVNFYDMLVDNALGNYRDALYDVTVHPIMGVWLSHVQNRGDLTTRDPDENYAREVQQLFSIGLYELKSNGEYLLDANGAPIETYTNEEIKGFARVFTGLHYAPAAGANPRFYSQRNYHQPMIMDERRHHQGEKVLLNGTVLPAGQPGMKDINDALDNIFQHRNVGPYISRLLIQRLVKSNPTKGYIRRVTNVFNDNGNGVRGDLAAVAAAILCDKEAQNSIRCRIARNPWRVEVSTRGTEYSRVQEPAVRYAALIRGFNATSDYRDGLFMIPDLNYHLNQMAYRPHHVFNFYDTFHVPQELQGVPTSTAIPNGTLYAPEFQIFTAVGANRIANRMRAAIVDGNEFFRILNNTNGRLEFRVTFDLSEAEKLASDPAALMQHLDLLLACGTLSNTTRDTIAKIVTEETSSSYFQQRPALQATVRARGAVLATLTASWCVVSE